jgi:hypothetical protein
MIQAKDQLESRSNHSNRLDQISEFIGSRREMDKWKYRHSQRALGQIRAYQKQTRTEEEA